MSFLFPLIMIVNIIAAVMVVVLVLLQQGKGADMGAAFGSGSAGSLFGAAGSANFFSRMTKWCAIVWLLTTLGLTYLWASKPKEANFAEGIQTTQPAPAPAAPVSTPASPVTTPASPVTTPAAPVDSSPAAPVK